MIFRNLKFFIFLVLAGLCLACNENKPIIPCLSCDGTPTPVDTQEVIKKVLLEEFTGVRCVNCPQAKAEIENLQSEALFGKNLVAVAYHAGFFSRPYPQSKFDFQTPQGDEIIDFLDQPIGFPSGAINRKQFPNEDDLQIEQFASWGGFVAQELEETAIIALNLETSYNQENRILNISANITPLQNITEALSLSVLITENNIGDVQLTPDGIIDNYEQTHVFRTMVTNTFGNPINQALISNQAVASIFSYTLPNEWVAENCKVVAFVHHTAQSKEVLQVEEIAVIK
jgi:hypothetical protein